MRPFSVDVTLEEDLHQLGRKKNKRKVSDEQKLRYLLKPAFFERLKGHNESVFPLYRLLMPEKDGSRFWKKYGKRLQRPIFVAATRQHVGKTTCSLALMSGLSTYQVAALCVWFGCFSLVVFLGMQCRCC